MIQIQPPWSNIQKVPFQARIQRLQGDLDTWNGHIEKLETIANNMKNDGEKTKLFTRIDAWKRTHRTLIDNNEMIILEGNGYLKLNPEPETTNVATTTPQIHRIPPLNIQKFNGDYLKWKPFWQRFQINVHNHPFSNVEKLDALIGLLEGVALDEVAGFEIVEENYDTVVNVLAERFENEKLVLKELYSNLRSIPPATSEARSLRTTVNTITNMCRQLENYGVEIDNDSLKTEIIEKMPPRENDELNWFQISENVTTEMILQRMKEFALKAELSSQYFTKTSPKYSQNYAQTLTNTCIESNSTSSIKCNNSSKKFACSLCQNYHFTALCPRFTSVKDKIQQLEPQNCCTNCARRNHDASLCRSNVPCKKCNGNHYDFLCQSETNKPNNLNTLVSLEAQQGCLLTKRVTVSNPVTKESVDATVIFDAGSQRSFISENLIRQLKLLRGVEEKLHIQGIGAKATNYISSKIQLRIKTNEKFEDINANSIETIANSISLLKFDENDITNSTVTKTTPDILIGMDYFFTFITSFERRNEMVVVHSKVGQMLSGKIQSFQNNTVSTLAIEPKIVAMGNKRNPENPVETKQKQKSSSKASSQKNAIRHGRTINIQHECDAINLSGGGECLAEPRPYRYRKIIRTTHLNKTKILEKSSVELNSNTKILNATKTLQQPEQQRSVDLQTNADNTFPGGGECRGEREFIP